MPSARANRPVIADEVHPAAAWTRAEPQPGAAGTGDHVALRRGLRIEA